MTPRKLPGRRDFLDMRVLALRTAGSAIFGIWTVPESSASLYPSTGLNHSLPTGPLIEAALVCAGYFCPVIADKPATVSLTLSDCASNSAAAAALSSALAAVRCVTCSISVSAFATSTMPLVCSWLPKSTSSTSCLVLAASSLMLRMAVAT